MKIITKTAAFARTVSLPITLMLALPLAAQQHVSLLPAPVRMTHGSGSLRLSGLCVPVKGANSALEDRFSREELLAAGFRGCTAGNSPIKLVRTGGVDALPMPGDRGGPESREAYRLSIARTGVTITAKSSAGVFYGVQTLLQMVERKGTAEASLPISEVEDYPSLPYRAILVDAGSEGPMLKVSEVKAQIDFLARWKGNQYFLYSEGNIEMKGYPLLNPHARFTQDEIREIVEYARERHIDVVPAIEMYGHLHDLFRIEKYSSLADSPHGVEFDPNNPAVAAVVKDWAKQINELFPSRFVDIGFDETWALSRAAERAGVDSEPYKLFLKQLDLVSGEFTRSGKTVLAWADIMVKFPGIVPRLPKGLIALPWWYEAKPDPEYKFWVDPLVKERIPHIVTSGVHSWNEIAPDFTTTFQNVDTWIVAGRRSASLGLLNTLWTDNGQMLMRMSWPGIAYGAAAAWQQKPMRSETFFTEYCSLQFSPKVAEKMASAMTHLNAAETALQAAIGQRTMQEFWRDAFSERSIRETALHRDSLHEARLHAEQAMEDLFAVQQVAPETPHLESFLYGAQNLDLAGMKFLYVAELTDIWSSLGPKPTREQFTARMGQSISNEAHSRAMDMMDGLSETQRVYQQAWAAQYTPYRMGTAMSRWRAELEFWRRAQGNLEALRSTFKTGDTLPALRDVVEAVR